jgi:hypothetical protein
VEVDGEYGEVVTRTGDWRTDVRPVTDAVTCLIDLAGGWLAWALQRTYMSPRP